MSISMSDLLYMCIYRPLTVIPASEVDPRWPDLLMPVLSAIAIQVKLANYDAAGLIKR